MFSRLLPLITIAATIFAVAARHTGADVEILILASNPTLRLIFLAAVAFIIGIPMISNAGHTTLRS